ncbi:MAG: hypothetical protein OEL57_04265 [Trichlorobacter sp.]|uniref:hypothetical protein n=1 Tax=Trichlorobacter sp. TaxID=2911007 RepID=UPI002569827C|nr:hypothetical protein [Trichlorobacter sp.]MDK9717108.1 hypothetical protein [Trichlorobacter sp.]
MIVFSRLICAVAIFALTGCAPAITQRYGVSSKNMLLLRDIASNSQTKVSVGKFEGDSTSVGCRGASMSPPENMTFASYLRNALIEELW